MTSHQIPTYIGTDITTSKHFTLPDDFGEQRDFITGKSGMGKSYLAGLIMEQMAANDIQFCTIDPRGAHIGLRNLAGHDGLPTKEPSGLNVMIVGGENGDIPLVPEGGRELADVLMETKVSCVLNIKQTGPRERVQFLTDFGRQLYQNNSGLMHIFIEEADEIIPQQSDNREEQAIRHIWRQIVKGGRSDGLLTTIISQQPQAVEKRSINASDCMIVLRMMGTTDIKAIQEWLRNHERDKARMEEIMQSIVNLPKGEAWVLAPEWLGKMVHIKLRERVTYHAGRTPRRGEERVQVKPYELGAVVERVKGLMQAKSVAVAQKMRSEADLRSELRKAQQEVERLKVDIELLGENPVVASEIMGALETTQSQLQEAREMVPLLNDELGIANNNITGLKDVLDRIHNYVVGQFNSVASLGNVIPIPEWRKKIDRILATGIQGPVDPPPERRSGGRPPIGAVSTQRRGDLSLTTNHQSLSTDVPRNPQMKVLHALVLCHAMGLQPVSRKMLAFMSGYQNSRSSGFRNPLSQLHTDSLIAYHSDAVNITPRGHAHIKPMAELSSSSRLAEAMLRMNGAQRKIFSIVTSDKRNEWDRESLASKSGYTNPRSSGFRNPLSKLNSFGVIVCQGNTVKPAKWLFE